MDNLPTLNSLSEQQAALFGDWDAAHRGASFTDPQFESWNAFNYSADAALLPEHQTLVARNHDLIRNNGFAAGGVQTHVDNVVGTGFRMSSKPDPVLLAHRKGDLEAIAKQIDAMWRVYANSIHFDVARQMTFNGFTQQIDRSGVMNGEGTVIPLFMPSRGGPFGTMFQLIDPARLSNPRGEPNTQRLRGGIEYDAFDAPIAYNVRKSHPGELLFRGTKEFKWERIPAWSRAVLSRRRFIHIHDKERTGQSRGKPLAAAVMPAFKLTDHMMINELKSVITNSLVAAFAETNGSPQEIADMFGGTLSAADFSRSRNEWNPKLRGGAIIKVPIGNKITPYTPNRPNAAFEAFMNMALQHIAVGLNMPDILLRKDFSKVNYSSARAALLEAWRHFMCRRQWLVQNWCQVAYGLWLQEVVNRRMVDIDPLDFEVNKDAWCRARWIGPGRGWIDPAKEIDAAIKRMAAGITTLEDECAEQGLDWDEQLQMHARILSRMRELEDEFQIKFQFPGMSTSTSVSMPADPSDDDPDDDSDRDDRDREDDEDEDEDEQTAAQVLETVSQIASESSEAFQARLSA